MADVWQLDKEFQSTVQKMTLQWLNAGSQRMVGVDISDEMLAIARQKLQHYPNVDFQLASASALPFSDASFDTVISANAFHYFDDPNVALKEMQRVLKPGGNLIIKDTLPLLNSFRPKPNLHFAVWEQSLFCYFGA